MIGNGACLRALLCFAADALPYEAMPWDFSPLPIPVSQIAMLLQILLLATVVINAKEVVRRCWVENMPMKRVAMLTIGLIHDVVKLINKAALFLLRHGLQPWLLLLTLGLQM